MSKFNMPVFKLLRLLGVLVFDLAVILAFFRITSVFLILAPGKLVLMFIVLLTGLLFFSVSVIAPNLLFRRKSGIVYPISIVVVSVIYLLVSNLISVFFIAGSSFWYVCWELFIFAAMVSVLSVILYFSNREMEYIEQVELERSEKATISEQLMYIEASLIAKQNEEGMPPILDSFKLLKERIQASTPFGRMTGNIEFENVIRDNLEYIQLHIRSYSVGKNAMDIQNLINETRSLVINREALNVK